MSNDTTLSVTFTMHLSEPLTDEERETIIGNLWGHIHTECHEGIAGFTKINYVDSPDGKYRAHIGDMLDSITSTFRASGVSVVDEDGGKG